MKTYTCTTLHDNHVDFDDINCNDVFNEVSIW